jgi:hypothetical protein
MPPHGQDSGSKTAKTYGPRRPRVLTPRQQIERHEHQKKLNRIRQRRAVAKRRANHDKNEAFKRGQRERAHNPRALAEKRERRARKKPTNTKRIDTDSTISLATLRRPMFLVESPRHKTVRETLTTTGPTDPIAASGPPTRHRSRRDTALIEAIAATYGESATLEQIAAQILKDPEHPWRQDR